MQTMTLKVSPEKMIKLKIKQCDNSANPNEIRLAKNSLVVKPLAIERKIKKKNIDLQSVVLGENNLSTNTSLGRKAFVGNKRSLKEVNSVVVHALAGKKHALSHKSSRLLKFNEGIVDLSTTQNPIEAFNSKMNFETEISPLDLGPRYHPSEDGINFNVFPDDQKLKDKKTVLFKTSSDHSRIVKQKCYFRNTALTQRRDATSRNLNVEDTKIPEDNSSCNNTQNSLIKRPIYSQNRKEEGNKVPISRKADNLDLKLTKVEEDKAQEEKPLYPRNLRSQKVPQNRSKTEESGFLGYNEMNPRSMNNSVLLEFYDSRMQGLSKGKEKQKRNINALKIPSFKNFSSGNNQQLLNFKKRKTSLLRRINDVHKGNVSGRSEISKPIVRNKDIKLSSLKEFDSTASLVKSFQRTPTSVQQRQNLPKISPMKSFWSNTPQSSGLRMNFSSFEPKNEGRKYLISKYQNDVTIEKFKQRARYFSHQRSMIMKGK
ncbi:unnamed protein product [Moneuplotes crassus]|uniref:Uncharacterized protein n=1 Tax=Euplotes crassus TaxID=5936 RepID=A0AAD1UEA0_EUPCR|nr:unnamed protein product [Moneuplotes crassus]